MRVGVSGKMTQKSVFINIRDRDRELTGTIEENSEKHTTKLFDLFATVCKESPRFVSRNIKSVQISSNKTEYFRLRLTLMLRES